MCSHLHGCHIHCHSVSVCICVSIQQDSKNDQLLTTSWTVFNLRFCTFWTTLRSSISLSGSTVPQQMDELLPCKQKSIYQVFHRGNTDPVTWFHSCNNHMATNRVTRLGYFHSILTAGFLENIFSVSQWSFCDIANSFFNRFSKPYEFITLYYAKGERNRFQED